jgi:hypothetical protein
VSIGKTGHVLVRTSHSPLAAERPAISVLEIGYARRSEFNAGTLGCADC